MGACLQRKKNYFMSRTYSSLLFHCVWSTKDRYPWLTDSIDIRVYQYIGGIVKSEGGVLRSIGGMPDHIHVLFSLNPTINTSSLIGTVKKRSTLFLRATDQYLCNFAWQKGFSVFSVSHSVAPIVQNYILKQKQHHEKLAFTDEYFKLLQKHDIVSDRDLSK